MHVQHDNFKKDFSFRFNTESFKFDHSECQRLIEEAQSLYNNDAIHYKKVLVSAPTLASFSKAAATLAADGFTVLDNEKAHSASFGHYAIRFVKSHSLQNEDREWIKETVRDQYIERVEANAIAYKAKLKAEMLAEEKAKEAAKQAEAEAKRHAKLEAEANKKFESLLQEQGIA